MGREIKQKKKTPSQTQSTVRQATMGKLLQSMKNLLEAFTFQNNTRIIMLGLDAAGKITILYRLKLNETSPLLASM